MHEFQTRLLSWYTLHQRDLPWRHHQTPYRILVSEMMLQQTQVERVKEKFTAWMTRWPTIADLAAASLADVLVMWQGLGYNRRARFLHECARTIQSSYGGQFPTTIQELKKLPGIGEYTAAAIAVFGMGQQESMVDVNIRRIMERWHQEPKAMVPLGHANDWHQALMDFGSLVCTARNPACATCPMASICPSFSLHWETVQKVKKPTSKDFGKRFEETDRYFRGRIIDTLRGGTLPMLELQTTMREQYKLNDLPRFGEIIESLMRDKLIMIEGNAVRLA